MSAAFWQVILLPERSNLGVDRDRLCRSALGLLRSYTFLIQHESDLVVAQTDDLRLIPKDVDWEAFCKFSAEIARVSDFNVSDRYLYGEIRLSRLNLYAPIMFGTFHYQRVHGQFADYFARLYVPVLFYFASMAMILGGMQVTLTGYQTQGTGPEFVLWPFFFRFSVIAVFLGLGTMVCFIALWVWIVIREWRFSYREHRRRRVDMEKLSHSA